jgi:hypothetical protein
MSKITLVTGLWDIGRGNLNEGWSRTFDSYLEKFSSLLSIDCNFIIYGDSELKKFVFDRRSTTNTQFVERGLSWFKNNEYFNLIQTIRNNQNWYNQVGWLKDSTQAKLEFYNPLVMSKMFLLNDAKILDKFDSEKLFWIDAGLTNTVHQGYFTHDNVLDKIQNLSNKFLFICFPYNAETEIHGFNYSEIKRMTDSSPNMVARGGFFGGDKQSITHMNGLYYEIMMDTLKRSFMGTEESLFTILTYQYPKLIDFCKIESNGLLYKFFEDVKNNQQKIESFEPKNENKNNLSQGVGLYVLSFNSPKQFETLIKSMLSYDPDFITNTKKFLLNNSTDESTTPEYLELCNTYGFEHIKKNNIGITGGRQFIAEHFNLQDDLGYYFFFEDDMFFYPNKNEVCKNGFNRFVKKLFSKTIHILKKENFDFLKLNFTEFYGSNDKQWSWYNVPQDFRQSHWINHTKLPQHGFDPNSPETEFKHIKSFQGLPYASGEIYLCNWPILMSKEGNFKCYLETKFEHPFEQTLMSHSFQQTIKGKINPGLLLISPTEHNRFDHYEASLRKEC